MNVTTPDGPCLLGDVLLTMALWIEAEQVTLDAAQKVEYASEEIPAIQRVEFISERHKASDWRISLQIAKDSINVADLRTGSNWPKEKD